MTLATVHAGRAAVGADGAAEGADARGFVFYTNRESRKGGELLANPHAALLFHWKSLRRQVRVEGAVERRVGRGGGCLFRAAGRGCRGWGRWRRTSRGRCRRGRSSSARVAELDARYPGDSVPRPPHWSGFRVVPSAIEFWQDMPFRLHDRRVYIAGRRRLGPDDAVSVTLLVVA